MSSQPGNAIRVLALGVVLTILLSGLVWGIHRESPRTLISFHGFLHAGVTTQFLGPAGMRFPPENPYFAGEPLCYYWFYQLLAAVFARWTDLNIFYVLEAFSFAAIAILVFAGLGIGRSFYRSTIAGVLVSFFVLAGTNPLGVAHALQRIARYGTRLLTDHSGYLWGVVGPMYGLIRFGDEGGLYGPFLNFFFNITSRPLALALLVAMVYFLDRSVRNRGRASRLGLVLTAAALGAFNPAMGVSVTGALVLSFAVVWFWDFRRQGMSPALAEQRTTYLWAGLALVAGTLLAAPTYYHLIFGPSDRALRLWLFSGRFFRHAASVGLSVGPLFALALFGSSRISAGRRRFTQVLMLGAFVLILGSVVLRFPSTNESNFFHAGGVLLAIPAAASVFRKEDASGGLSAVRWRVAAVILFFSLTPLLLCESYLGRPAIPVALANRLPERTPADSDLARLYEWVRKETPQKAVFIIDPTADRVTAGGNISEFPAMTSRCLFTERGDHYLVEPYADAARRIDLAARLHSAQAVNDADRLYLRGLDRPLYLLFYRGVEQELAARLTERYGPAAFLRPSVMVFKVEP